MPDHLAPQTFSITRPDDWHLHVRDGAALQTVVPHTAAQFGRALIMPNLKPPVTSTAQALAYRGRIHAAAAAAGHSAFEALMTLYLTDTLPPDEIVRAKDAGISTVVFDRGGNRYAGRVAALADGAREGGLDF